VTRDSRSVTSGAKARFFLKPATAGLKPRPATQHGLRGLLLRSTGKKTETGSLRHWVELPSSPRPEPRGSGRKLPAQRAAQQVRTIATRRCRLAAPSG